MHLPCNLYGLHHKRTDFDLFHQRKLGCVTSFDYSFKISWGKLPPMRPAEEQQPTGFSFVNVIGN